MFIQYLRGIPSGSLQVAIVGKDPFPGVRTCIPFCKPNWKEQLASNCSGRYVLSSLGVDLAAAESEHETPGDLFMALRDTGIVFLNASYEFIGGTLRREHLSHMEAAYAINEPILQASKAAIFCGEAWKVKWIFHPEHGEFVIHPDVRNRHNPRTKDRWSELWGEKALSKRLGLTIPSRGQLPTSR